MLLPPKSDGSRIELPKGAKQVTIIGANGSGKTRFTEYLEDALGNKAFHLSALDAISQCSNGGSKSSIDKLYNEAMSSGTFLHANAITMFERLMEMLLNEEMVKLVEYKVSLARGEDAVLPESKLDAVIRRWQDVFPENHVLREKGGLSFSRSGENDTYSQKTLSHGEKAVLFYFGAVLYAPDNGVIFVENPGIFLHNSLLRRLWDTIEGMRPDCRFVYTTHDVDFAASRSENTIVWVRSFDPATVKWDYDLLPSDSGLSEEVYMALIGARRPVLFVEGDATHSIDAKLYPLIFREFNVKSLGSCNKVIEATRAFNDLKAFHHLESRGIVDRDRRDEREVEYLRGKNVFVPEVAEIENILMLEPVIKAVAHFNGKDADKAFALVKQSVVQMFRQELRQQALLHTRHRVKRTVEYRVDGRFTNINALEEHMQNLVNEINPRGLYEEFCRKFWRYVDDDNYAAILQVFNQKTMVPRSNVSQLCGFSGSKESYVQGVLMVLKSESKEADVVRRAVMNCFGFDV